jgi:CheY-like chemotaxis protein
MYLTMQPSQRPWTWENLHNGSATSRKNILIVEDDPFWQQVIRRNIETTSDCCRTTFVTSVESALDLLDESGHFDLIVADQFLDGEKTGYDLWRTCNLRGLRMPFLLTSGNIDFPEDIVKDKPLQFIPKPFVAAEIRRTLHDLLSAEPPENYYGLTPLQWKIQDPDSLNMTLRLVLGALLAFFVYTAATPLFIEHFLAQPFAWSQ